jgi:hypothetical protein
MDFSRKQYIFILPVPADDTAGMPGLPVLNAGVCRAMI